MGTSRIGTGQAYTTIASWESSEVTGTRTEDIIGECLAEEFNENVNINGSSGGGGTYFTRLRSEDGAEHDGRAFEVSGVACARIRSSASGRAVVLGDDYCDFSWLEVKQETGDFLLEPEDNNCIIHHNIFHGDGVSRHFVRPNGETGTKVYRNIGYGTSSTNSFFDQQNNVSSVVLYHNTCFQCKFFGRADGSSTIERNISFNCVNQDFDNFEGANTGENAATDSSGDTGLENLTASDNLQDPDTVNYNQIDLRILDESADVYQASSTIYSTTTYPQINVPISNRSATITDTWSVGADDIVPVTAITRFYAIWMP